MPFDPTTGNELVFSPALESIYQKWLTDGTDDGDSSDTLKHRQEFQASIARLKSLGLLRDRLPGEDE